MVQIAKRAAAFLLALGVLACGPLSPKVDCTPASDVSGASRLEKGDKRLQNLSYQMEVSEWSEEGLRTGRRVIETRVPDLGVQVQGGWLVGRDDGEWGGEIVFVPANGTPRILERTNVRDIYSMPDGEIVVAGIAHLSTNMGALYLVQILNGHDVTISKLHDLPGAPRESWIAQSGGVMIDVFWYNFLHMSREGVFKLDEKRRLKPVKCKQ